MLTPVEQRFAGITLAYLERCTSVGTAFFAEILTQPQPGSVAATSLADKDLMEPIYLAAMYLQVALDHYLAVQSMFIPAQVPQGAPPPTVRIYAPYTVVRAALEADAWACWLLDPAIGPTERLARAMTVRALNLREVRRLGLASTYDERVARVSDVAARHNLPEKRNDEGGLLWVGASRPNMTELLNELLPDCSSETNGEPLEWHTYSVLSARAHGEPWAILHKAKPTASLGPYAAIAEVVIDVVDLMRLLSIALRLHSEAVRRAGILDGRETGDWEARRGPTAENRLPSIS